MLHGAGRAWNNDIKLTLLLNYTIQNFLPDYILRLLLTKELFRFFIKLDDKTVVFSFLFNKMDKRKKINKQLSYTAEESAASVVP
jgi:hypothetical protein